MNAFNVKEMVKVALFVVTLFTFWFVGVFVVAPTVTHQGLQFALLFLINFVFFALAAWGDKKL